MTVPTNRPLPLVLGSGASVAVATAAVAVVATAGWQRRALLVTLAGLVVLWSGVQLARRDHRILGVAILLVGCAVTLGGLALGVTAGRTFSERVELLPGQVGLVVLASGLAPVRRGWERRFVTGGTALVLVSVLTSGVVYGAEQFALLAGTAATVVAWDLGEQAINLGEHVGRRARTWRVELVHGAAGGAVGVVAIATALGVRTMDVVSVSFAGLLILLGAVVVMAVALYH